MTAARATATVDRYELHDAIASGGMATVYLGRRRGSIGFSHVVAIKRIHQHLAENVDFVEMFIDEAHLASRIRHPNVVPIVDIVDHEGELLLVMDYVAGVSLSQALKATRKTDEQAPLGVVVRLLIDALCGLHAAHTATDERGESLGIVHRDVSPHNLLVGCDGVTRLLDFGVAKARGRLHRTRTGELKGKAGYMAPEQMRGETVDRRADLYALGLIGWEALVGRPAFDGESDVELMNKALSERLVSPAELIAAVPTSLAEVVMRLLERSAEKRYATALDAVEALEAAGIDIAPPREVAAWLQDICGDALEERAAAVTRVEQSRTDDAEEHERETEQATDIPDDGPKKSDTPRAPTSELPTKVDRSPPAPAPAPRSRSTVAVGGLIVVALAAGWYLGRGDSSRTTATVPAASATTTASVAITGEPIAKGAPSAEPVAAPIETAALSASTAVHEAPGAEPRPRPQRTPPAKSGEQLKPAPDDLLGRD